MIGGVKQTGLMLTRASKLTPVLFDRTVKLKPSVMAIKLTVSALLG